MARIIGLSGHRLLSPIEITTFLSKRQKLINKFWAAQGLPPPRAQLAFSDAVSFIVENFSKHMPHAGSVALSALHLTSTRAVAGTMGFDLMYYLKNVYHDR